MRLIIGYGNWLRRDDGLGVWLAELPRPDWTPISAHQLLPEHAEVIHRAQRVVFLDAAIGAPVGAVHVEAIVPCEETDHTHALGAFTHNATPRLLLGVARDLYGFCPSALLISVNGGDFGHGDGFSAPICARLAEITAEVDALIDAFGSAESADGWLLPLAARPVETSDA